MTPPTYFSAFIRSNPVRDTTTNKAAIRAPWTIGTLHWAQWCVLNSSREQQLFGKHCRKRAWEGMRCELLDAFAVIDRIYRKLSAVQQWGKDQGREIVSMIPQATTSTYYKSPIEGNVLARKNNSTIKTREDVGFVDKRGGTLEATVHCRNCRRFETT